MAEKIIMATIDDEGSLTGVGRAPKVAIIKESNGKVESIEEIDVKWGESHEREQEGLHHASIAKFIKEHNVNEVVAAGAGPNMQGMLGRLKVVLRFGSGNYKQLFPAD
ncbi:MAG: hypothetical protein M1544_01380 [Candidatus Marsarchaeota archaeon]|nr:hypothetical protein [Candidatus Marsarchaeota archaeon]